MMTPVHWSDTIGRETTTPVTTIVRTVCAHDCPDMCFLPAHVEAGRRYTDLGDGATYQWTFLNVQRPA
jgi:hypothetical protein